VRIGSTRLVCLLLSACGPPATLDAGTVVIDAGPAADSGSTFDAGSEQTVDAGVDGGRDAGVDAGTPAQDAGADAGRDAGIDAGPLTLTAYPRQGEPLDDVEAPMGPGLVLMGGGTDVDDAFRWAQRTLAGDGGTRRGDVVVLRATGADGYTSYLLGLAPFRSVQTLKLNPPATRADLLFAADVVSRAEFVFFAGGDQAHYAAWAGTPLLSAVQQVYARGGVVGGTSAGLAILGEFSFDALAAGPTSVTSSIALADPRSPLISFSQNLLRFEPLRGVVTDSHFRVRDRLGRLVVFAARQHADGLVTRTPREVLGLGVDEATALVVDSAGRASLRLQRAGEGGAWAVRVGPARSLTAGQPLQVDQVQVTRLTEPSMHTFDLSTWCGTGPRYALSFDGGQVTPPDLYTAAAQALCP